MKIKSLDGLRFIMAMSIVMVHLGNYIEVIFGKKLLFFKSAMPVDYFFILSGFGMMLGFINRGECTIPSVKSSVLYAINHIKKIYPIWIATVILCIPFVIVEYFDRVVNLGKSAIYILSLFLVKLGINVCLLQSLTGMMVFTHTFNGVGWFLSSLFVIYIFSPFIMYLLNKCAKAISNNHIYIYSYYVAFSCNGVCNCIFVWKNRKALS